MIVHPEPGQVQGRLTFTGMRRKVKKPRGDSSWQYEVGCSCGRVYWIWRAQFTTLHTQMCKGCKLIEDRKLIWRTNQWYRSNVPFNSASAGGSPGCGSSSVVAASTCCTWATSGT